MRRFLLILCLGCLAGSPVTPPVPLPPPQPPPKLARATAKAPPGASQLELEPGWTAVSFPVERLDGLLGLEFALCRQTSEGCVAIQPDHWSALDTSLGYWAYSDKKTTLRYWGKPEAGEGATNLFAGWNLLGCPRKSPLALSDLSLASEDGEQRTFRQATGAQWLSDIAYRSSSAFTVEQTELGSARLVPGQTLWVYAYRPLRMWRDGLGEIPPLRAAAPGVLKPGDTVTLTGPEADAIETVTLRGLPISDVDILQRAPSRLTVRLPEWASSGELVPYRGTRPLDPVSLKVEAPDPLETGLLMGQVEDSDGEPLAGAQARVGELQALTGPDGRFYLSHLPAGPYAVSVSAPAYKEGVGQVVVGPGKLSRVLVTLSPTQPRSEAPRGRMFITAYPYDLQGRRFWVKSIRAWEVGDYARRAYDSWWIDASSRDLDFNGVRLGSRVRVEITWVDARGVEKFTAWDRRFWKDWQHEYFYSPWN